MQPPMTSQSGDRRSERVASTETSAAPCAGRCIVVLCDAGHEPAALLEGLRSRGVTPRVVFSAPRALVSLRAHEAAALIVDQPTSHAYTDELVAAVSAHLPTVVCWGHESVAGRSKLSKLAASSIDATSPSARSAESAQPVPIARSVAAPSPRQLHLTGELDVDGSSPAPAAESPHRVAHPLHELAQLSPRSPEINDIDQPLISREELQMLLGPSPRSAGNVPETEGLR